MSEALVLLVEDDSSDARLIQRAFGKLSAAVSMIRLSNGDDAVAYLSGDSPYDNRVLHPMPSIVVLDIKLPRRSGFEVLEWLRAQRSALRRMPVVMLTSSRHTADINRAYDLGANSYVAKPETGSQMEELASNFRTYWLEMNEVPDLHDGAGGTPR